MADLRGTAITWLGHAGVAIRTRKGTAILIDPWVGKNPKYPKGHQLPSAVDLLLFTHGHGDHFGDAVPLAKQYRSGVVAIPELCGWLGSQGVENTIDLNLGGSYRFKDVTVTMVEATHSSSVSGGDKGGVLYGGVPVGFVLTVEGGPVLYHAGDTAAFSGMELIRELHAPEIGMLPIGDHYTMGPREAALAAKLLGLKAVLPIHFGTFPVLTGTPEQLKHEVKARGLSGVEVLHWTPGETIS